MAVLIAVVVLALVTLAALGLAREYFFWRSREDNSPQTCRKISVIIPMRGIHQWTVENLKSITSQTTNAEVDYIFVVDTPEDPAYGVAQKFGRVILSKGPGKNIALATALERVDGDCVVVADDDIKPGSQWLHNLTSPLAKYDAVTSYRWYVGSELCHRVKLSLSNLAFPAMLDERSRFVWGGSTAFRRELISELIQRLPKYVSDDYVIYSVLKERGGRIWFAKSAIVPTPDSKCAVLDALRWGIRQILMVKWHAPIGWRVGLFIYTTNFVLSIVFPIVGVVASNPELLLGLLLHPINLAKDVVRARGVGRHAEISISLRDVVSTWAVGTLAIPLAIWTSIFVKCVDWRGRRICR